MYSPEGSKMTCPTARSEESTVSATTFMVLDLPILVLPKSAVRLPYSWPTKSLGSTLTGTTSSSAVPGRGVSV